MKRLTSVFVIALMVGCSAHYSAGSIAGTYMLSVAGGIDTLALNANGTYSETYKPKNGRASHQEGTWTLEELQAGSTVVLNDFRSPFAADDRKPGLYLLLAKRSFGRLYLITDIDLGEGYKKQP